VVVLSEFNKPYRFW